MNKDRIVGSARQMEGRIRSAIGKAIGDRKLQAEGVADQVEGKVQNAIGSAKDAVKDVAKT